MSAREPSEDLFIKQVENHQMMVGIDQGLYRHLTFKQPKTSNRYFHITTWPGYLTISGDMGCYVFARLPDMFEFFRCDKGRINLGYWAEKLQADEKHSGHREFSGPLYRRAVVSDFKAHYPPGTPGRMAAWKDFRWELLDSFSPSTAGEAIEAVHSYRDPDGKSRFDEFWDHTLEDYTFHFIWCCRAINWAIQRYDVHKADERFPGLAHIHTSLEQTGAAV